MHINRQSVNNLFVIVALLFCSFIANTQVKVEKEVGIEEAEVPSSALDFIKQLKNTKKIKWYKEYGLDKTSIEAKLKIDKESVSIEFDKNGLFEDAEIKIRENQIPPNALKQIRNYLNQAHRKFKFTRIQKQHSGDEQKVIDCLNKVSAFEPHSTAYEIVISTREDKKFRLFEYLFSVEGEFILRNEIVIKNADYLEY